MTIDDENQLICVWKVGAWSNSFAYDGKMRRRIAKAYSWSGSSWTLTNEVHYVYDGNLVVQERDGSNSSLVEYTRGTDLSGTMQGAGGIGGLLARSQNSQSPAPLYAVHSYYHADGNGNVTMLLYANGTVAAKYLYDPYGNTLAQSGPLADANSYRFSSKEWNQNSGLYYYLYRFFDGNLQRWLNRDPIGEKGGKDLYVVADNNCIGKIDLFGHDVGGRVGPDWPWDGYGVVIFGEPNGSENCLAYGLCMPGFIMPDGKNGYGKSCDDMKSLIKAHYGGGNIIDQPKGGPCPSGTHALSLSWNGNDGFHVQRQDSDGSWSEQSFSYNPKDNYPPRPCKPSGNCPGNLCAPNKPIKSVVSTTLP